MGLGLDMAPGPQPGSCPVGSPLGLIRLSLLLTPAAGASTVPAPTRAPLVPVGQTHLCSGDYQGWQVALGVLH